MISFDEALAIIGAAVRQVGSEVVPIDQAAGRVLAAPVIAAIDSPRADVSAMDGYAVRSEDLAGFPVSLRVVGESFPGVGRHGEVGPGQCVRIVTGAPIPAGADRIVIQEQVRRESDAAVIDAAPGESTWVRSRGADFRCGDVVLAAGRLLDPAALIAAAGADAGEVEISVRPRVTLLSTGDELADPGHARASALTIPDSVTVGIAALAAAWGAEVIARNRLPDDLAQIERAASEAVETSDIVVVTGGASVGERDFAKAGFAPLGLELLFSKVSMRPGKPAWFGRAGETLVLGLPGNPTSALVTARLLLAPLLAAMHGRPMGAALEWETARLGSPLRGCDARETFHRARLAQGVATPVAFQESHAQKALAEAQVLVRQPAGSPAMAEGATVEVLRL